LQIHGGNQKFIDSIIPYTGNEFNYLFDASGGNGIEIQDVPKPFQNKYCAYAGGLSPDNIKVKLELLDKSLPNKSVIGIDMESGVRTDGVFDLEKVKQCLLEIEKYTL
jgi:phosphoribosylanthranilate isomerase